MSVSYTAADYAAAIWAYVPRTLGSSSSGETHSSEAMAYAEAVWTYIVRTLTDGGPASAAANEDDVRMAAVALLEDTGAFDDVYPYSMPEERGRKAGDRCVAVVEPAPGRASTIGDDLSTGEAICTMRFVVTVIARHEDAQVRDRKANRMIGVVQNALNGRSIASLTLAQSTRVLSWDWQRETPPERRVRLTVQADYLAPAWVGFNTDE
ncbi:MAG TPA: hypothetical protein VGE43_07670 [Acidimicrobiales bacterium]